MTTKDMKAISFDGGDTYYTVFDATARSDISTLSGTVSGLSGDISNKASINVETTQNSQVTTGTISLDGSKSIYTITPSSSTTFTFDTSGLSLSAGQIYTFELYVSMASTVYSLSFPNSVTWQDGESPDLSATGYYFLVFRTIDAGTTWYGNLQGKW